MLSPMSLINLPSGTASGGASGSDGESVCGGDSGEDGDGSERGGCGCCVSASGGDENERVVV